MQMILSPLGLLGPLYCMIIMYDFNFIVNYEIFIYFLDFKSILQLQHLFQTLHIYLYFQFFRMSGSNKSPAHRYPWHMAVFTWAEYPKFKGYADDKVEQKKSRCGGTLISVRHILTSASCVEDLWKVP